MRSLILKTAGGIIAVFMALVLLAAPSASAQTYPPVPPPPAQTTCATVPAPSFSASTAGFELNWPGGNPCVAAVTLILESTPTVIYSGPLPATGKITGSLPASITSGSHTLTISAKLIDGGSYFARYTVTVSAATPVAAAGGASTPAVALAAAPTAADLAFTGSDIQLPIAIGASLVGVGGLALLTARKRSYKL